MNWRRLKFYLIHNIPTPHSQIMLLTPDQQKILDWRNDVFRRKKDSGLASGPFLRTYDIHISAATLDSWEGRYDPLNPYALTDARWCRPSGSYKLKGELRVILLALWFLFVRRRRRRDGILTASDAPVEAEKLLEAVFGMTVESKKMPKHAAISGLWKNAGLLIPSFSPEEDAQFGRVLDEYGRFVPHANFLWLTDARQYDPAYCSEHNFVIASDDGTSLIYPWSQIVMDVCSRAAMAGDVFEGAPDADRTTRIVREAVLPKKGAGNILQGVCRFLRYDLGSENKGELPIIMDSLGCECSRTPKACPKCKAHIERLHLTFAQYLQIHPADFFQLTLDGRQYRAIRFSVFRRRFKETVDRYNRTRHSEILETPYKRWLRCRNSAHERLFDPAAAASAFCYRHPEVKVYDNCFVFEGKVYQSAALKEEEYVRLHVLIADDKQRIEVFRNDTDDELLDVVTRSQGLTVEGTDEQEEAA